jgi:hypothetical protein
MAKKSSEIVNTGIEEEKKAGGLQDVGGVESSSSAVTVQTADPTPATAPGAPPPVRACCRGWKRWQWCGRRRVVPALALGQSMCTFDTAG